MMMMMMMMMMMIGVPTFGPFKSSGSQWCYLSS